jgi:hypothetical protein
MPDLSVLTTGELHSAKNSCEYLMQLHDRHHVMEQDLHVTLSSYYADVCARLEDHAAAERRSKVQQAAQSATVIR